MLNNRVTRSRTRQTNSNAEATDLDDPSVIIVEDHSMEIEVATTGSPVPAAIVKADISSQTTPGLLKNGGEVPTAAGAPENTPSDDEEQSCPICFELWTSSGDHRISSLSCGHLFGRSCIDRWLQKNKSCPQCKAAAKRRDIRNIYAKSLKVVDTTDRDQAKKQLAEAKYKCSIAEENEAKALLKYHLLKIEMDKLKAEIQASQAKTTTSVSNYNRQPVAERPCAFLSSQSNQPSGSQLCTSMASNVPDRGRQLKAITKSYTFQKTLQVSQKEARVVAFDKGHMLMTVSRPSQNQLFNGFGILKISSLDARSTEFISVHQKTIRDMKFNQTGDQLLLTGSMDKTLKITSVISNSVVQTYTCPAPVWACNWNERNINYVFAGLQNGSCVVYDIRKTNELLAVVKPRTGVPCPIVSLAYVPPPSNEANMVGCEGVLVGTLKGGWFLQSQQNDTFIDHQLLFPDGACNCLSFEPSSRHCLLSQRPGKQSARSVHHVYNLVGDGSFENPLYVNNVQQCYGGNRAQNLTRSHLFTCPDDNSRLMICAGDEASSSVAVFDGGNGRETQKLSCVGGTVFDVMTFDAYDSSFLVALTEQKLNFFKWQ